MRVYIGQPAWRYGPHGETQQSVTLDEHFGLVEKHLNMTDRREQRWLQDPWFLVHSSKALRRDVCVAGHYLRIVLREDTKTYPSRFGVWIAPMNGREGKSIPHGWGPSTFVLALHRADPGEAALDFFRLFQPGPAE